MSLMPSAFFDRSFALEAAPDRLAFFDGGGVSSSPEKWSEWSDYCFRIRLWPLKRMKLGGMDLRSREHAAGSSKLSRLTSGSGEFEKMNICGRNKYIPSRKVYW